MKKLIHIKYWDFILGLIFCLLQVGCDTSASKLHGVLDIPDFRNSKDPEIDLASHKPYEVIVFRTYFMGDTYRVRYYQNEKDSLYCNGVILSAEEDYNKLEYQWENDTTVSLRLFSTISNKEQKFSVSGSASGSSLEIPD